MRSIASSSIGCGSRIRFVRFKSDSSFYKFEFRIGRSIPQESIRKESYSWIRVPGNQDAGYQATRISEKNKKRKYFKPDALIS
jgi:hypothetical protein